MGIDIKNFYLGTPLDRYECMRIPISLFLQHIIDQYNLRSKIKSGHVYLEIRNAIYGVPQAGILANKQLCEKLESVGYCEVAHTPGLWRHVTRPVQFSLVVDDFGVKYVGKENAEHLIQAIKAVGYEVTIDWEGELDCGISLRWNYEKRHLDISMPGYIEKLLTRHNHVPLKHAQHSPYKAPPKKYGLSA